jgi:hypothetical protein
MKGTLKVESLSVRLFREVNLEGGLLYWGHWMICRKGSGDEASLYIGAPLGNLDGGSYTGHFEKWNVFHHDVASSQPTYSMTHSHCCIYVKLPPDDVQ